MAETIEQGWYLLPCEDGQWLAAETALNFDRVLRLDDWQTVGPAYGGLLVFTDKDAAKAWAARLARKHPQWTWLLMDCEYRRGKLDDLVRWARKEQPDALPHIVVARSRHPSTEPGQPPGGRLMASQMPPGTVLAEVFRPIKTYPVDLAGVKPAKPVPPLPKRVKLQDCVVESGYKVVSIEYRSQLTSAFASYGGAVAYRPGKWTFPPRHGGPLFVYTQEDSAMRFARHLLTSGFMRRAAVYTCDYVLSPLQWVIDCAQELSFLERDEFDLPHAGWLQVGWTPSWFTSSILTAMDLPENTAVALAVRLNKELPIPLTNV